MLTWLGHGIHFNLVEYWLAAVAVPFIALGAANHHANQERKNGTIGWWLALSLPRYQLMASQWMASAVLAARSSWYLLIIAILGIYTIHLKGTLSAALVSQFLFDGLIFTALMYCLVPLGAAIGRLLGVLRQSRLQASLPGAWVLIGTLIWLASTYQQLVTVPLNLSVSLHHGYIRVILASWALALLVLWMTIAIFERFPNH